MHRILTWGLAGALAAAGIDRGVVPVRACFGVGRHGEPVVNADQTVLMVWNPQMKIQHFIRKANFKTAGTDFGFVVPTPGMPELAEADEAAFGYLMEVTKPNVRRKRIEPGTKSAEKKNSAEVRVLSEQTVAGFKAVVLEADRADALAQWLGDHEFENTPAVAAWADPYVRQGWKFTVLKLAKDPKSGQDAVAKPLRLTFKTERPIFPYREPESKSDAKTLHAFRRLLRLHFIAETQYQGILANQIWQSPIWSGRLADGQRAKILALLKLPADAAPASAWLTTFEHAWPYELAAADVEFRPSADPQEIRRPDIVEYLNDPPVLDANWTPVWLGAVLGAAIGAGVVWRLRRVAENLS